MANLGSIGVDVDMFAGSQSYVPSPAGSAVLDYGTVGESIDNFALPGASEGWGWFGLGVENQWGSTAAERIDWINDTIKAAIINALPNQDTAQWWSDLSATEVSGTGYTAGGKVLTSKTLTYTASTNTTALGAADLTWSTVTFSNGRWVVLYKDTGTSTTSPLMGFLDLGKFYSPSAQDFNVKFGGTVLSAVS